MAASTPIDSLTADAVVAALQAVADPEKALLLQRYFRTGEGEYGEGDVMMGVAVPVQRKVARAFRKLPLSELHLLLEDRRHECRLTALLILLEQLKRSDASTRERIAHFYLEHIHRVNNWDLVDTTAPKVLGPWLDDIGDRSLLTELAESGELWRERVAVLTTLHWIKRGDFTTVLKIANMLLGHPHDLIHKAVGWMLREVGQRDRKAMEEFLGPRYRHMPRTMLRYAIEKLPDARRQAYLKSKI